MDFATLFSDKTIRNKEKTTAISDWLTANPAALNELIAFAKKSKDPVKATCIEAVEFACNTNPAIATAELLHFVTESLGSKSPRVKWESAKVIGNIAALFPKKLDEAVKNLLINTEDAGTVVRWSAAYALGEIVKLKTPHNINLVPSFEAIILREENNGVKKNYLAALKKHKAGS